MKKAILFCSLLVMLLTSVAFAAMPRDEMYVGGVGAGVTLGYVRSVLGEPADVRRHQNEGIKGVVFTYSDSFRVVARARVSEKTPEDEMVVTGFWLSDASLATPGGIKVGMSYGKDVADRFGPGREVVDGQGNIRYVYEEDPEIFFSFYVDKEDEDTIIVIQQETNWNTICSR